MQAEYRVELTDEKVPQMKVVGVRGGVDHVLIDFFDRMGLKMTGHFSSDMPGKASEITFAKELPRLEKDEDARKESTESKYKSDDEAIGVIVSAIQRLADSFTEIVDTTAGVNLEAQERWHTVCNQIAEDLFRENVSSHFDRDEGENKRPEGTLRVPKLPTYKPTVEDDHIECAMPEGKCDPRWCEIGEVCTSPDKRPGNPNEPEEEEPAEVVSEAS